MFWRLVFSRQYTWLNSPDLAGLVLPWFQMQTASLHRWALTLWDPYQWCGHPIAAEGQAGVLYPLNWLLWALPLHRTWLRHVYLNWYFVLIHFQAALFAYWLCRDQRRSRAASLLGGIAFASGPFFGTNAWPAALNALAWAPVQFMFFLRALGNRQPLFSAAACGAALGASWLSGSDEIPIALSLAFAVMWIWRAFKVQSWKEPALVALAAFGIGAMQILPGLEYLAYRPSISAEQAGAAWQAHAIGPMALVNLVMPNSGDQALFIGWTVLAFAALGVWRYADTWPIRISICLAAAGLALATGPYTMFGGAIYGARLIWKDPHSALCLLALALPLPAAAGLDVLAGQVSDKDAHNTHIPRALLQISALCGIGLLILAMTAGDDLDRLTPLALCGLGALLTFALFEARRRAAISARAVAVCGILLAMWDFGHITGVDWRNIEFGWPYLNRLSESTGIAELLRSEGTPLRLADPDRSAGFEAGDWFGLEQFDGLTGGTANVTGVADLPTARALAGTGFIIDSKRGGDPAFQTGSGLKLYSIPDVFPRAWAVNRVDGVENQADARARLSRPVEEFRRAAFVNGAPPKLAPCNNAGTVGPVMRRGSTITVHAGMPCAGMVIIGQTFYRGWTASVDGRPVKLYQADGFLDGVAVPAGEHVIALIWRPWTVFAGAALSAISAVLLILAYKRPAARNPVAHQDSNGIT